MARYSVTLVLAFLACGLAAANGKRVCPGFGAPCFDIPSDEPTTPAPVDPGKSSEPEYELQYFNFRARAEGIRYAFHLAGQKFKDTRIPFQLWPEIKKTMPLGQLPLLKVDDKTLVQSMAIARYIAREFGLAGENSWDAAVIDMICDTTTDVFNQAAQASFSPTNETKAEAREKTKNIAGLYSKLIANYKRPGTYILGDKVTLADAIVTAAVEFLHSMVPDSLDGLHNLRIIKENFQAIPAIREYIRNRPATSN